MAGLPRHIVVILLNLAHQSLAERVLAVEQQLLEALERAWAEYQSAEPAEKAEARKRYRTALQHFAELVIPR